VRSSQYDNGGILAKYVQHTYRLLLVAKQANTQPNRVSLGSNCSAVSIVTSVTCTQQQQLWVCVINN